MGRAPIPKGHLAGAPPQQEPAQCTNESHQPEDDGHDGNDACHGIVNEGEDADAEEYVEAVAGRLHGGGVFPERFAKGSDYGSRKFLVLLQQSPRDQWWCRGLRGGASCQNRTGDLLITSETLYQLS